MSTVLFSKRDKQQIHDALPPAMLKMRLPELYKFLKDKDVDDAKDVALYPQIASWHKESKNRKMDTTIKKVESMLKGIPQTAKYFQTNAFIATLLVFAVTKAIHDKCYDADYDFDFSNEVQPVGIWVNNATQVEFKRKLFNTYKKIDDYQFACKLTKTSCAKQNAALKNQKDDTTMVLSPLVYKKYDHCYLGKDHNGPKEGCFAMGPLRNICDLIGFKFDEKTGECIFDEKTCSLAGKTYDPETKRCWTQNMDYLFGLMFTDSALLGAKAIEYKIMAACKKHTKLPTVVCAMSGARIIGVAAGITGSFLVSLAAFPDAMLDPDNGVKVLETSFKQWAGNVGFPTDFSKPENVMKLVLVGPMLMTNPLNIFKVFTSSVQLGVNAVVVGLGVGFGKLAEALGVSKSQMERDAKNWDGFKDGVKAFFTGELF